MCTVILLWRPDHDWPLMIAANRDERLSRPWRPPGRHWPDRPTVVGGYDTLLGGSWIGLNDFGVMSVVLNRRNTLGPAADKFSRGTLVLQALDWPSATEAADVLCRLDAEAYRPFNLIIADRDAAFWLCCRASDDGGAAVNAPRITAEPVPPGFSLIAADDLNDARSPRLARLSVFQAAPVPDPQRAQSWQPWERGLADRQFREADGPIGALCVVTDHDYGTVSASLIALPAATRADCGPIWRFAAGRPGETPFEPVPVRLFRPDSCPGHESTD